MSPKSDPDIVSAPWDEVHVALIEAWQRNVWVHQLTCPNCAEDRALKVTPKGLTHPCGYTQDWVPRIVVTIGNLSTMRKRK